MAFFDDKGVEMDRIKEIAEAVENGKARLIEGLVLDALEHGQSASEILERGLSAAMGTVGALFQAKKIFIPEMLMSAKTMKTGVAVLRPLLGGDGAFKHGKYIIGTVKGDMHDIGKSLVALMVGSVGFEVIDLGVDIAPGRFVDAIRANPDCKVVGASCLLTTTMDSLKATVKAIAEASFGHSVKVMVGGAPITQEFSDMIGADAYAPDAASAAVKAAQLVGA